MTVPGTIPVGNASLDLSRPVVMGVINITPDSFWEGSRRTSREQIVRGVDKAVADGTAVIDFGGYSSRPGADDVSPVVEYDRLAAAMEIIRDRHPDAVVSIDTFRAEVAAKIIGQFGACIVNDISAGELDPEMIPAVASLSVPYIAMHMRGDPATMQQNTAYRDIVGEVADYLCQKALVLKRSGVEHVILDPGFGFAKTTRQNHILLGGLETISSLGYPVLAGVSRKSMIYNVIGGKPEDALAGTTALNWEALRKGASILRVHDVKEAVDTVNLFRYYSESNG